MKLYSLTILLVFANIQSSFCQTNTISLRDFFSTLNGDWESIKADVTYKGLQEGSKVEHVSTKFKVSSYDPYLGVQINVGSTTMDKRTREEDYGEHYAFLLYNNEKDLINAISFFGNNVVDLSREGTYHERTLKIGFEGDSLSSVTFKLIDNENLAVIQDDPDIYMNLHMKKVSN